MDQNVEHLPIKEVLKSKKPHNVQNSVAVDTLLDLGILGKTHVQTTVFYAQEKTGTIGTFDFAGTEFAIPSFVMDLQTETYAVSQVNEVISAYLADHQRWLQWIQDGVISGVNDEKKIGSILYGTYFLDLDTIALETSEILKYNNEQLTKCLKGTGLT